MHPNCRCEIETLDAMYAGTATMKGNDGADYHLAYNGELPDYYITTKEATDSYGYRKGQNTVGGKAPGKMLGGDIYENKNGHLPSAQERTWYEADINYIGGKRNNERIVYSSDGLVFVTYDHYKTFIEIIIPTKEEQEENE